MQASTSNMDETKYRNASKYTSDWKSYFMVSSSAIFSFSLSSLNAIRAFLVVDPSKAKRNLVASSLCLNATVYSCMIGSLTLFLKSIEKNHKRHHSSFEVVFSLITSLVYS